MSRSTLDNEELFARLQELACEGVHLVSADIVFVLAIQRDNVAGVIADHTRPDDDPETRRIVAAELRAFLTQFEAGMPPADPKASLQLTGEPRFVDMKAGPRFPPKCSRCGRELERAEMVGVGFNRCPLHPNARVVYRLQEARAGYPAGWPMCSAFGCAEPALDGKETCGQVHR